MTGTAIGFVIWCITGCFFIALGIYSLFSKKAIGFWANAKMFQVTDVKKYNRAMCKLFCIMGVIFIFLGFPLLSKQNSVWILLSVIGVMLEVIAAMIIYTNVIEKKYKKIL
ncbi:MAG: hypothetical protein IJ024_02880 [Lachnospiraceae bacterium]|nr:hypothetical protein [Lachnospiraceae bacterium]